MTKGGSDSKPPNANTWMVLAGLCVGVLVFLAIFLPISLTGEDNVELKEDPMEIALRVLNSYPLIDGHNDLANNMRELTKNQLSEIDLNQNLTNHPIWGASNWTQTDIPRLKEGKLGAQFWATAAFCPAQYKDSVEQVLEQIDVVKRFVALYPDTFELVTTAAGIEEVFSRGKLGSLIGLEGGHGIDNRLAVLRLYYKLGVRYMTLNLFCNTPWSDAYVVDIPGVEPGRGGLSEFGKLVIKEMNRLGMMVDLSHTSIQIQKDILAVSTAPIIFSHSNCYQLCANERNVHDDVLQLVKENNGLVMVNFYQGYLSTTGSASIQDVANHINHIRRVAGEDHVGIGSDFDGIDAPAVGLEHVSKYPNLIATLAGDTEEPWTEQQLRKLVGQNLVRVLKQVEQVRDEMALTISPIEELIPPEDIATENTACMTP